MLLRPATAKRQIAWQQTLVQAKKDHCCGSLCGVRALYVASEANVSEHFFISSSALVYWCGIPVGEVGDGPDPQGLGAILHPVVLTIQGLLPDLLLPLDSSVDLGSGELLEYLFRGVLFLPLGVSCSLVRRRLLVDGTVAAMLHVPAQLLDGVVPEAGHIGVQVTTHALQLRCDSDGSRIPDNAELTTPVEQLKILLDTHLIVEEGLELNRMEWMMKLNSRGVGRGAVNADGPSELHSLGFLPLLVRLLLGALPLEVGPVENVLQSLRFLHLLIILLLR